MLPASNLHIRSRPGGTHIPPSAGNRSEPAPSPARTAEPASPDHTHLVLARETTEGKSHWGKKTLPATGNAL